MREAPGPPCAVPGPRAVATARRDGRRASGRSRSGRRRLAPPCRTRLRRRRTGPLAESDVSGGGRWPRPSGSEVVGSGSGVRIRRDRSETSWAAGSAGRCRTASPVGVRATWSGRPVGWRAARSTAAAVAWLGCPVGSRPHRARRGRRLTSDGPGSRRTDVAAGRCRARRRRRPSGSSAGDRRRRCRRSSAGSARSLTLSSGVVAAGRRAEGDHRAEHRRQQGARARRDEVAPGTAEHAALRPPGRAGAGRAGRSGMISAVSSSAYGRAAVAPAARQRRRATAGSSSASARHVLARRGGRAAGGAVRRSGRRPGPGPAAGHRAALVGERPAQPDGGLQLGAGPVEAAGAQREHAQLVVEVRLFGDLAGQPRGLLAEPQGPLPGAPVQRRRRRRGRRAGQQHGGAGVPGASPGAGQAAMARRGSRRPRRRPARG